MSVDGKVEFRSERSFSGLYNDATTFPGCKVVEAAMSPVDRRYVTGPILSRFIHLRACSSWITLSKCSRKPVNHFKGLKFEAKFERANQGEDFGFKIFVDFNEGENHTIVKEESLLCVLFKFDNATDGSQVNTGLLLCDSERSDLRNRRVLPLNPQTY